MNTPHPARTPTTIATENDRSLIHEEMEHFMEDGYTFDVNEHKSTFHNHSGTSTSTLLQNNIDALNAIGVFPTTAAYST